MNDFLQWITIGILVAAVIELWTEKQHCERMWIQQLGLNKEMVALIGLKANAPNKHEELSKI